MRLESIYSIDKADSLALLRMYHHFNPIKELKAEVVIDSFEWFKRDDNNKKDDRGYIIDMSSVFDDFTIHTIPIKELLEVISKENTELLFKCLGLLSNRIFTKWNNNYLFDLDHIENDMEMYDEEDDYEPPYMDLYKIEQDPPEEFRLYAKKLALYATIEYDDKLLDNWILETIADKAWYKFITENKKFWKLSEMEFPMTPLEENVPILIDCMLSIVPSSDDYVDYMIEQVNMYADCGEPMDVVIGHIFDTDGTLIAKKPNEDLFKEFENSIHILEQTWTI